MPDGRELVGRVRALAEELDVAARVIAVDADSLPEGLRRSAMVGRILGMKSAAQRMRALLDDDCSGCSMPGGRHWDTCPNRRDGRPTR